MTKEFWDKKHKEKYSKEDWAGRASIFAMEAMKHFPESGKVLEIGTGQGGDSKYFHSLGYGVIATDFSDEALKSAKERAPGVEFLKVDTAQGLPFGDEYFDVVYSHMALHYFDLETTKSIFADIHRVLKKDGIVAFIVNTADDPEKDLDGYTKIEQDFYRSPDGIEKRYFSVESVRGLIKDLFEPIVLDNQGQTYKDEIKTLIRFIGKKK